MTNENNCGKKTKPPCVKSLQTYFKCMKAVKLTEHMHTHFKLLQDNNELLVLRRMYQTGVGIYLDRYCLFIVYREKKKKTTTT